MPLSFDAPASYTDVAPNPAGPETAAVGGHADGHAWEDADGDALALVAWWIARTVGSDGAVTDYGEAEAFRPRWLDVALRRVADGPGGESRYQLAVEVEDDTLVARDHAEVWVGHRVTDGTTAVEGALHVLSSLAGTGPVVADPDTFVFTAVRPPVVQRDSPILAFDPDGNFRHLGGRTVSNVDSGKHYVHDYSSRNDRADVPYDVLGSAVTPVPYDGRLYLVGGEYVDGGFIRNRSNISVYDFAADAWVTDNASGFPVDTDGPVAYAYDGAGKLYVVGPSGAPDTAYVVDLDTLDVAAVSAPPKPIPRGAAAFAHGKVVCGPSDISRDLHVYDVGADAWSVVSDFYPDLRWRYQMGVVGAGSLIAILGGQGPDGSMRADVVTLDAADLSVVPNTLVNPHPRHRAGYAADGDRMVVSGGFAEDGTSSGDSSDVVFLFEPPPA